MRRPCAYVRKDTAEISRAPIGICSAFKRAAYNKVLVKLILKIICMLRQTDDNM